MSVPLSTVASAVLADADAGACRSVNGEVVSVVAALCADGNVALKIGQIDSAAVAVAGYAIGVRTDKTVLVFGVEYAVLPSAESVRASTV